MHAPVAVLERVDRDETKRQAGGRDDRVQSARFSPRREIQQASDEARKIAGPGTDMVRQRRIRFRIPRADKTALIGPALPIRPDARRLAQAVRAPRQPPPAR